MWEEASSKIKKHAALSRIQLFFILPKCSTTSLMVQTTSQMSATKTEGSPFSPNATFVSVIEECFAF